MEGWQLRQFVIYISAGYCLVLLGTAGYCQGTVEYCGVLQGTVWYCWLQLGTTGYWGVLGNTGMHWGVLGILGGISGYWGVLEVLGSNRGYWVVLWGTARYCFVLLGTGCILGEGWVRGGDNVGAVALGYFRVLLGPVWYFWVLGALGGYWQVLWGTADYWGALEVLGSNRGYPGVHAGYSGGTVGYCWVLPVVGGYSGVMEVPRGRVTGLLWSTAVYWEVLNGTAVVPCSLQCPCTMQYPAIPFLPVSSNQKYS